MEEKKEKKRSEVLKTYEILINNGTEQPQKFKIEGYSVSAHQISDTECVFKILDVDEKSTLFVANYASLICCQLLSEEKIIRVKKSKKVISIAEEDENESETNND